MINFVLGWFAGMVVDLVLLVIFASRLRPHVDRATAWLDRWADRHDG